MAAMPERLGRQTLTLGEASPGARGTAEEEGGEEARPYVPEWPHVTEGSTLSTTEAKLEWLQNCLPPNVLAGYSDMGTSAVMSLGVQSALLGVISAVQAERVMAKQARYLKENRRALRTWEEAAESNKTKQQELVGEVAVLTADLSKVRKDVADQEALVKEKDAELASKEKELGSWAEEARRMQGEIERAQAEAADAKREAAEAQRVAAEAKAALERSEGIRGYLMKTGIREVVAKIFASDSYVSEVAGLVPKLQATGRVMLLQELQAEYFPEKDIKELPGYVKGAVEDSNAAFAEMQEELKECAILEELAGRPEMGIEEIKALEMPKLQGPGSEAE